MSRSGLISIVTMVLMAPLSADAGIYKCTDAEGNLTYSQAPCPNQKTETIRSSVATKPEEPTECADANRFAFATAQTMRSGTSSAELFDRYGGLDSLTNGTISLINYVYAFSAKADISEERIAALTQAKCRAGSFGDVGCEALPLSYTEQLGGCAAGTAPPPGVVANDAPAADAALEVAPPESALQPSGDTQHELAAAIKEEKERKREQCREIKQRAIDGINSQMRSGYTSTQGDYYRERLRELQREKREC